jgi:hypothetical protein
MPNGLTNLRLAIRRIRRRAGIPHYAAAIATVNLIVATTNLTATLRQNSQLRQRWSDDDSRVISVSFNREPPPLPHRATIFQPTPRADPGPRPNGQICIVHRMQKRLTITRISGTYNVAWISLSPAPSELRSSIVSNLVIPASDGVSPLRHCIPLFYELISGGHDPSEPLRVEIQIASPDDDTINLTRETRS